MIRSLLLCTLIAVTGCTMPSPPRSAPTAAEFAALLSRGGGPNIAVTADEAADPVLRSRRDSAPPAATRARIVAAIGRLPRWRLLSDSGDVLWATRTTRLFRFVDDIYIGIEASGPGSIVRVRSASRVGRSDLGQNRRNIAELWAGFDRTP
jgi:uncharacterized protein (DUF1499 family)